MKRYTADVLVPAYNEEELVSKTLRSIASQRVGDDQYFKVQVLVNGSTDHTLEVVKKTIADLQHKEHFEFVVQSLEEANKIKALQFGLDRAVSPLVICVDADALLAPNCFEATLREFDDPHTMVAGPLPQVIINKSIANTLLGSIHRAANICRRMYEVMSPSGAMLAYRRGHMTKYPEDIASDDSYVTFTMALRFGWKSVRVAKDAVVYWVGAQNWIDHLKQESRFVRATTQLLERFPELVPVREAQIAMAKHAERRHTVQLRFAMKRAGLPLSCLVHRRFWQRLCEENAAMVANELIGTDGRWERIRSTKLAPDCESDPLTPC